MKGKLYSFRFDDDLVEHVRAKAKKNNKTLTAYIEKALKKVSGYKEKELV